MIGLNRGRLWDSLHKIAMLLALLVPSPVPADVADKTELRRLEGQLDSAMTQGEMNVAAGELARYWDNRLVAAEKKIERRLSKKERKEFSKSKKRWRAYRSKEVAFRAIFFEGGSIQPLIANDVYSEITEHRVKELESLFQQGLEQRAVPENSNIDADSGRTNRTNDIYLLPCSTNASVAFEGVTQAGRDIHRLEVRRLSYRSKKAKEDWPSMISCVIYYAGDEYGPSILRQLDDCMDPFVRKISDDMVEIYFLAGAHTHFRQRWKLLGWSAELQEEEAVEWDEDPRNRAK